MISTSAQNSPRPFKVPMSRRIVGYMTSLIMALHILIPGIASATTLLSDSTIEYDLNNDPQFEQTSSGAFNVPPYLQVNKQYHTVEDFYQTLLTQHKQSLGRASVAILLLDDGFYTPTTHFKRYATIGSAFVQARYVREQILRLLGRHLINADEPKYASETRQLDTLYANALEFAKDNPDIQYGTALNTSLEAADRDMIWPEVRTINGKPFVVPIVYLTENTVDARRVVGQNPTFNGEASFRDVVVNSTTIRFGRNGFLNVVNDITNNGGKLIGSGDLTIVAGGSFTNLSGLVQAEGDLTVAAQRIENRTLVHRYEIGKPYERFGEIAEAVSAQGDVTFRSYSDIALLGANVDAGGEIIFQADGDILIGGVPIQNSHEGRDGWREYTSSSIEYLRSRLSAENSIRLIAGGEITIDAAELTSKSGHIELLAELGVTVQDQQNVFQLSRKGKFGNTSFEESVYRTTAMRALLDAGKGITIHSEAGDITLKAADIRSGEGTSVNAQNGQINLLITEENDHYSYSSISKGLFTVTNKQQGHEITDVQHTTVVGGFKVNALKGLNVEYRGKFDDNGEPIDLDGQIHELSQLPGLEWMAEVRANVPEATWTAIKDKHETWDTTSRTLSPAFAAVITIVTAAVSGGAANGVLQAALAAGYSSVQTQLMLGLANSALNGSFDQLGEAMDNLVSSEGLRSLAITMVTAGALDAVGDLSFFQVAKGAESLSLQQQIAQALTESVVSSGIRTIIEGGNLDQFRDEFINNLQQSAINMLGDAMFKQIRDVTAGGRTNDLFRYIALAGRGCIIGALSGNVGSGNGNDSKFNCASGAGGAIIGELISDAYNDASDLQGYDESVVELEETLKEKFGDDFTLNGITDQQYAALSDTEKEIYSIKHQHIIFSGAEVNALKRKGVNIARIGAAMAAMLVGADVNTASSMALALATESIQNAGDKSQDLNARYIMKESGPDAGLYEVFDRYNMPEEVAEKLLDSEAANKIIQVDTALKEAIEQKERETGKDFSELPKDEQLEVIASAFTEISIGSTTPFGNTQEVDFEFKYTSTDENGNAVELNEEISCGNNNGTSKCLVTHGVVSIIDSINDLIDVEGNEDAIQAMVIGTKLLMGGPFKQVLVDTALSYAEEKIGGEVSEELYPHVSDFFAIEFDDLDYPTAEEQEAALGRYDDRLNTFVNFSLDLMVGSVFDGGNTLLSTLKQRKRDKETDKRECFVAGTLIHTHEGLKPIEQIRIGDRVLSHKTLHTQNGKMVLPTYKPVVQLFVNHNKAIRWITFEDSKGNKETLGTTDEHPFWSGGAWLAAGKLKTGNIVINHAGKPIKVVDIKVDAKRHTTYNFEVADYHTYFVGQKGIWVHNECGSLATGIKWKGFSKGKLQEHYEKHVIRQKEFGDISQAEYLKQAKNFAKASGIFKEKKVGNLIVKYEPSSGRVLIGHAKSREIRTFYIEDGRDADPFQVAIDRAKRL